ncbi:hypothetical protein evm_011013 [Chilo suppressalis]|nr:hypothetical protein evm_011013 [Chilo suppressalis]
MLLDAAGLNSITGFGDGKILRGPQAENWRVPLEEESKDVTLRTGSSVAFNCYVDIYGNPAPTTVWEFINVDSVKTVLKRGNSNTTLYLNNVSKANEGLYLCIVRNKVSFDRIRINVTVH